jgi:hypothetical protein
MRKLTASLLTFVAVALLSTPAMPVVDDMRVRQLENEIMRLQRELDAQSRRIETLERSARMGSPAKPGVPVSRATDSSPAWLVTANWDRIRPGMKELDVIALLGRPTSLGPNAVLAGNVRLGAAGVAEINRPVLK